MVQSYKLRLSDGTILVVDHDGLNTWLVDRTAMVQASGSTQWHPLKEFLAKERSAARTHARRRSTSSRPRDPLERELPLIPPPPRKDASPLQGGLPPPDPSKRELPLVPPPPRNDKALPEPPALFVGDPVELSIGTPPGIQVLAEEPSGTGSPDVGPQRVPAVPVTAGSGGDEVFLSLPPSPLAGEEDRPVSVSPEPPEPDAFAAIGEPAGVQVLADEPAAPASPSAAFSPSAADTPVIRLRPLDEEASAPPTTAPWQDPRPAVAEEPPIAPPWLADDPVTPPAERQQVAPVPPEGAPVLRLKPLEHEAPPDGPSRRRAAAPAHAQPVGPARRNGADEPHGAEIAALTLLRSPLGEKVLRATHALGTLLSRAIAPINRLERGLPLLSVDEPTPPEHPIPSAIASTTPAPSHVPPPVSVLAEEPLDSPPHQEVRRTATAADSLPVVPLTPPDGVEAARALDRVRARASAWAGGVVAWVQSAARRERSRAPAADVMRWVRRLTRPERSRPPARVDEPAPARARVVPPPPVEAPPRLEALPVLRFAETRESEPEEVGDVYDGEEAHPVARAIRTAWLWTKRLVLTGVLVGGTALAALTWETWFPKAARFGQTAFTEIALQARSRETARERQRAVDEAGRALPHLAPETIRLVMEQGSTTVLEAPEVFHVASDAAQRGLFALTPGEAADLKTLQGRVLAALPFEKRESVLAYEHARASRAVFPAEDREVVPLVASGVRALPVESQERLRTLLAKAVAAGLRAGVARTP